MKRIVSGTMLILLLMSMLYTILNVRPVAGWSNGGFSTDPQNPNYGTHDWIAQHALDWLPEIEKEYIINNLAIYLYGTELPDNGGAPDGIGDTALHHVYYWSNESLQEDASAVRAQTEYTRALNYIKTGNVTMAVKTLGIMSHYIVDVGVFGHVMGSGTDWDPEAHHSDYETYVNDRTDNYTDEFNTYLVFDRSLDFISAYNATCALGFDTTFDVDGDLTCVWMDQNYNWSNPTFKNRCGESLNLAVNYLADVLHTLYLEVALPIHNIDTGLDYATIQEAINAPETLDGHIILVEAGAYYENVVIDKSLILIGEDRHSVIDGKKTGTVLDIISDNVTITGFTIRNSSDWPGIGIWLNYASYCNITKNNITNNGLGIRVHFASNNIVHGNNITNNEWGVFLGQYNNTVSANNIVNNEYGVYVAQSSNGTVYHNNFVNNTQQASMFVAGYANIWDDGYPSGGNYWSDYVGVDADFDGIGDTPYIIDANNTDRYPLMGPFSTFEVKHWDGLTYNLDVVSNSSISDFKFTESLIPEPPSTISFNVSGQDNTMGFCRVTIPNIIVEDLWQGNYTVLLNGEPWPFTNWTGTTNTYIYINYTHSEHEVVIIPEFLQAIILPLLMTLTMFAVVYAKRKLLRKAEP